MTFDLSAGIADVAGASAGDPLSDPRCPLKIQRPGYPVLKCSTPTFSSPSKDAGLASVPAGRRAIGDGRAVLRARGGRAQVSQGHAGVLLPVAAQQVAATGGVKRQALDIQVLGFNPGWVGEGLKGKGRLWGRIGRTVRGPRKHTHRQDSLDPSPFWLKQCNYPGRQ